LTLSKKSKADKQLREVDKKLEKLFDELTDDYPKLNLWSMGSVRRNSFTLGTLLKKRRVETEIDIK